MANLRPIQNRREDGENFIRALAEPSGVDVAPGGEIGIQVPGAKDGIADKDSAGANGARLLRDRSWSSGASAADEQWSQGNYKECQDFSSDGNASP